MIKDESKEQISLFDLPQPEKPAPAERQAKAEVKVKKESAPPEKQAEAKVKVEEKPAPQEPHVEKKPIKTGAEGSMRKQAPNLVKKGAAAKTAPGPVPEGDVRLTANIRQDLHLKLKIVAATRRTTIGELIEELVEQYL